MASIFQRLGPFYVQLNRKAFSLLELVIVLMMLSVLAIIGLNLYLRSDERARGSEAKTVLGNLRKYTSSFLFETGGLTGLNNTALGIGSQGDMIPPVCRSSHYFSYSFSVADPLVSFIASRCTGGTGKTPSLSSATTRVLVLTTNFSTGEDIWTGDGGY